MRSDNSITRDGSSALAITSRGKVIYGLSPSLATSSRLGASTYVPEVDSIVAQFFYEDESSVPPRQGMHATPGKRLLTYEDILDDPSKNLLFNGS